MSCKDKCGFSACGCLGIVISIVFAAIIAVLFAFGLIPFIVTVTWIAFGLAVLALIILIIGIYSAALCPHNALQKCICRNAICLLAAIIGTIISAIAALAIVLIPIFISVIILVAIGAFFFALMMIGLIAFISCIVCRLCSIG